MAGTAREDPTGWVRTLRGYNLDFKFLPANISYYEGAGKALLFSIHRGFSFLSPRVYVAGYTGTAIGFFKGRIYEKGGSIWIFGRNGKLAEIKGGWRDWSFKIISDGSELGAIEKKWRGPGSRYLEKKDDFALSISPKVMKNKSAAQLVLAAALSIEILFEHEV